MFSSFTDASNSGENSYLTIVLYFLTQFVFITGIYILYNEKLKDKMLKNTISYSLILSVGFLLMIYFLWTNIYIWVFQNLLLMYANYNSINFIYTDKKQCLKNIFNLNPYIIYKDDRSDEE
jgi:glucan phosphoethanolaminetransferase (alkaline phosphatase superfamily)